PACAGTTAPAAGPRPGWREHPRVRGDDLNPFGAPFPDPGTPPRARGRRRADARGVRRGGNTPACAGTTHHAGLQHGQLEEHPRVRGDDAMRPEDAGDLDGTPPRARGRPRSCTDATVTGRNTPACAGTTYPDRSG